MYDPFAYGLINNIPDLEGLTPDATRRALSRAYFTLANIESRQVGEVPEAMAHDMLYLRRLANTLESRAVFDNDTEAGERHASAFVAAEALSLLARIRETVAPSSASFTRLDEENIFSRVEAALLYIISSYDANAGGVIRTIPDAQVEVSGSPYRQAEFFASEWALNVLVALCTFHLNPLPVLVCPVSFPEGTPTSLSDLQSDVRGRLHGRMGEAVSNFIAWLTGDLPDGFATARDQLTLLADQLAAKQFFANADIHHLARLLLGVLGSSEYRSLVHAAPPPEPDTNSLYQSYLQTRARGPAGGSGRPLLWPSVQQYVKKCLPGPKLHAVVSMPTGSGKSFLAELAISHALVQGWVLYLVPTNALAHQVRRDLRRDLESLAVDVRAFIGDGEYTTLEGEHIKYVPPRTVAVMTPEKCSLSLRLNPEAFSTCRLCVFDECHLIGEKRRGITAEIVLSQLMVTAPGCRFLLMSAIVQNPDDLAKWLHDATGSDSVAVPLAWRPTRSLRCAVGVDDQSKEGGKVLATQILQARHPRYRNQPFEARFALLAGLQGAWQSNSALDYGLLRMKATASLELNREPGWEDWIWTVRPKSWVNESSRRLGQALADAGIPTLIFLPKSKHYPFLVGSELELSSQVRKTLKEPSQRVRAFLTLADDELGSPSAVGRLIDRGISVHTSALLETEQLAAEQAFRDGTTIVMVATGTLAQGLNLPALAVVIGGTEIGFSPGEDPKVVEQRKLSQLLNASGRAGRAGFANQGIVLAIPDTLLYVKSTNDAPSAVAQMDFLSKADAAVSIWSQFKPFLDAIVTGPFDAEHASLEELNASVVLSGGSPNAPAAEMVLSRTYAAYLRSHAGLDKGAATGASRLAELRTAFLAEPGTPEWLPMAAQRAGLDFLMSLRLYQAWKRSVHQTYFEMLSWTTQDWLDFLFEIARYLTPRQMLRLFGAVSLEKSFPEIYDLASKMPYQDTDSPTWVPPASWTSEWQRTSVLTRLWIEGMPIKDIAARLVAKGSDSIPSDRGQNSPIPKAIIYVKEIMDGLALLAGGVVAIAEGEFQTAGQTAGVPALPVPIELSALPLCIKYGCNSVATLAWYRFGLRFRRAAYLLAQAFPLDPHIEADSALLPYVRSLRRQWLSDQISVPQPLFDQHAETFDAIKVILTSAYDE